MIRTFRLALLFVVLAFAGSAFAQERPLRDLLPAETLAAFGTQGLADAAVRLEPFIAEWERLDLTSLLIATLGEEMEEDDVDEFVARLEDIEAMDVIGRQAWIAVSASSFNPVPHITLAAELEPDAERRFAEIIEEARADATELMEGDVTLYQLSLDDPESPWQLLAYAQVDAYLFLSTNPDALRGMLRRLAGSDEPGFTSAPGFASTLGALEGGEFEAFVDYSAIAAVARPFGQGLGADRLVRRLGEAFTTAGVTGSVTRIVDGGIVTESVQTVDPAGGDTALSSLLTMRGAATDATLSFAPADALAFSSSYVPLSTWWQYLNSLALSVPELGGSLDDLLLGFLGFDLRGAFFDWTGNQVTTITTGVSEVVQPGVPAENLLGEVVYVIEAEDVAAAEAGLEELFAFIGQTLAMFGDPMGGTGSFQMEEREVGGVRVRGYDITPGVHVSFAVTDGFALIATSSAAMTSALEAHTAGPDLSGDAAFSRLVEVVPEGAVAFSYTDAGGVMRGSAGQIGSQLQMTAGLGGASQLDFDAVLEASEAFEEFLLFVADYFGSEISYSEVEGNTIYSFGQTEIDW